MTKFIKDTYKLRLWNELQKLDISDTLDKDIDGNYIVEEGYASINPSKLGINDFMQADATSIMAAEIQLLNDANIPVNSKEGKKRLRKAIKTAEKHTIIIPEQIVRAVESEFSRKEQNSGKILRKIMQVYKYTKLRLPSFVWKYNVRNFFGDLDAVFIGNPSAIKKVPQAVSELYGFYYKYGKTTDTLNEFIERTGLVSGQTSQELKKLVKSRAMDFYLQEKTGKTLALNSIKKAWKVFTMETATEFREQVLRYAAYLQYSEQLSKSKNNLPEYYGASVPIEIQSLTNMQDRAAKLANDLVGAYDDVSVLGQYTSDHLMPFFRFKEVNLKRYYRMIKNTWYNDPLILNNVGNSLASKLGVAGKVGAFTTYRLAKIALGASAYYIALMLFNKLIMGDEEDKLPEEVKNSAHITLPPWIFNDGKVHYIDRIGSASEFVGLLGIDGSLGSDLNDIATGRMTLDEKLKEIAMTPIYDIFNSSHPLFKIATELLTGKQLYPDPSNPTNIRDKWEYMFNQVGLKDEYNALAGKPFPKGNYGKQKVSSILSNSVLSGDAAYWNTYDAKETFYKANNISKMYSEYQDKTTTAYKRSNAAYYYKMALKLDDKRAATKYLAEYMAYGGTGSKLNQSLASLHPLFGMSNTQKSMFLNWMNDEERKEYDRAVSYYNELIANK
jgi:hypothetical protein